MGDFIDSVLYRFAIMKLPLRAEYIADFIDSVLYRFAIMKLPLRAEDIAVSEEAEVRRVVRASLSLLAKETGALLRGETARGGGLDVGGLSTARNQLQGLLNILQA